MTRFARSESEPAHAVAEPARLVARLDGLGALRDVYGDEAAGEIAAAVEGRMRAAAGAGVRMRRAGCGVYAFAAGALPSADLARLAERLQRGVGERQIDTCAGPAVATLSVGAATGPAPRRADILRAASRASLQAELAGPAGRRICGPGPALRDQAVAAARAVVDALRLGRAAIAFQPVTRSDGSGVVAFHECLARLLDPSGAVVPAAAFMPALEELGMTRGLDRRILELALAELAEMPTLRLSVNVSAQSLGDPGWLRILEDAEAAQPGLAARLIVEITESALIADESGAHDFVARLRRLSAAVALDDFGAGFSAFRHLRELRPDILKIDGAFASGVSRDPDRRAMIESILVAARHFEMMTVAEKVNDAADAEALAHLGIDALQGFSLGKPAIEPDWRAGWSDGAAAAR